MDVWIAAGLMLASSPAPEALTIAPHDVTIEAGGRSAQARYHAVVAVETTQRGMSAGVRPATARCDWQARLTVSRELGGSGIGRPVETLDLAKGSLPGGCIEARRSVTAEVARQQDKARLELAAAATRDRPALLAEVAAIRK